MKNIALCFDRVLDRAAPREASNAAALAELLARGSGQLVWSCPDFTRGGYLSTSWHAPLKSAHACVAAAYEFLVEQWVRGDRIYLFGSGRGAACARALTRLLGTFGVLRDSEITGWTAAEFRQYVLATYAMPRTYRGADDWGRVGELAAKISGTDDVAVEVAYLGLWDCAAIPGRPPSPDPLGNVVSVRHALALDGGWGPLRAQPLRPTAQRNAHELQEVWFRGAHCDVAGGPHACAPLADITLDWMLDGAVRAGVLLEPATRDQAPAPVPSDALAGHPLPFSARKVPGDATVHASVASYVRAHPSYWRRLPAQVVWADPDWADRSERLVSPPTVGAPPAHRSRLVHASAQPR